MSQPGTVSLERPTPKIATITFSNPPVNLIAGQTVTRLHALVAELGDDPGIQVLVRHPPQGTSQMLAGSGPGMARSVAHSYPPPELQIRTPRLARPARPTTC